MMDCPNCGAAQEEDFDGFGFIACRACHYCTHPSLTGGVCDICGIEPIREKYGDRRAIDREQVAPLFGITEEDMPW